MPTQRQNEIKTRVERRALLSEPMLRAMGVHPDAFAQATLNAMVVNPAIAECTPESIETAIIHAVNAKLVPDGREAAIVPFNSRDGKVATFIPMIEGQIKLALAASPGMTIRTRLVYQADEWEYAEGLRPVLRHVPHSTGARTEDQIVAAYAVADLPGGGTAYEVMLRGDIDRHRGYSRSRGNQTPWNTHYGAMAEKTVARALVKRLPKRAA